MSENYGQNTPEVTRFIAALGTLTPDQWRAVEDRFTSAAVTDEDRAGLDHATVRGLVAVLRATVSEENDFVAKAITAADGALKSIALKDQLTLKSLQRGYLPFAETIPLADLGVVFEDHNGGKLDPARIIANVPLADRFVDRLEQLDRAGWKAAVAVIDALVADGSLSKAPSGRLSGPRFRAALAAVEAAGDGPPARRTAAFAATSILADRHTTKPQKFAVAYEPFLQVVPLAAIGQSATPVAAVGPLLPRLAALSAAQWRSVLEAAAAQAPREHADHDALQSELKVADFVARQAVNEAGGEIRAGVEAAAVASLSGWGLLSREGGQGRRQGRCAGGPGPCPGGKADRAPAGDSLRAGWCRDPAHGPARRAGASPVTRSRV